MKKLAVLGLLTLIATPVALADGWLPQAQNINKSAVQAKDQGARQTNLFNGRAKQNEAKTHQVQLVAGKYYSFFADCETDCSDINLSLKSSNGQIIEKDHESDDSPMFGWRANRSGTYTLTVIMPECETASGCRYSSQVFMGTKAVFH